MILENKVNMIWFHGVGGRRPKNWHVLMHNRIMDLAWKASGRKMPKNFVRAYAVNWGNKVQDIEDRIVTEIEGMYEPENTFLRPFDSWMNRANKGLRRIAIDITGDVMTSFDGYGWEKIIKNCVIETLVEASQDSAQIRKGKNMPEDSQTVTILLGHSLGSIIICKICHEIGKAAAADDVKRILKIRGGLRLNSIFIWGSPFLMWDRLSGGAILPKFPSWDPVKELMPTFVNLYCRKDVLSSPIKKCLIERYPPGTVRIVDCRVGRDIEDAIPGTIQAIDRKVIIPGIVGKFPGVSHVHYQKSRLGCYTMAREIYRIWKVLKTRTEIDA